MYRDCFNLQRVERRGQTNKERKKEENTIAMSFHTI
jgi:hypothetical protein